MPFLERRHQHLSAAALSDGSQHRQISGPAVVGDDCQPGVGIDKVADSGQRLGIALSVAPAREADVTVFRIDDTGTDRHTSLYSGMYSKSKAM